MSEEQKIETLQEEKTDIGKTHVSGRKNGRRLGVAGAIVVIFIAIITGIAIYNAPANRLSRQLDLGNRYLTEQNYERAIVEFDKAIAIDSMRIDAYLGKAEAYDGLGDADMAIQTLADGYERTEDEQIQKAWLSAQLELAHKYFENHNYEQAITEFDKALSIDSMNAEAYLNKAQLYKDLDNIDMALQTLEEGLECTKDAQIKEELVEYRLSQAKEYVSKDDYEKALEVYDGLLELDSKNAKVQSDMETCLEKYLDSLMKQGLYDKAKSLIEKYQDKVSGIDFQVILDEILVRENVDLLFEDRRYDEAKELVEQHRTATDDVDFQKTLDSLEEQIIRAENSAWVDELYEKMISGDCDAVFSIITEPDFLEKCSVFKHAKRNWAVEYELLTSDGKVVGVFDSVYDDYFAVAYCVHNPSKRPNYIYAGDYVYEIADGRKQWLIDNKSHGYSDGEGWFDYELSAGEGYNVFHVG